MAADAWQDFDIALIVSDLSGYLQDPDWSRVFGEPIMVQEPYKSAFGWEMPPMMHRYAWLDDLC
ncbi:MAG: aminoglycoside 6-adenylyltransferase [Thermomicrobiales bacterium]|nr:aminoglycoside 6-adenylyltransferase [Thermomicrobiales bacterium]